MSRTAHILSVAHSITTHERGSHANPTDAFVNCAIYMAKLLHRSGWRVLVYAVDGSEVPECDEVIPVVAKETYERVYASRDDSKVNTFSDTSVPTWVEFCNRCPDQVLHRRHGIDDLVLPMFGAAHQPITERLQKEGMHCIIEACIGHPGAYAPFRVYCSYAWFYTDMASKGVHQGHSYYAVIPHFVPPEDFPFDNEKDPEYAVYLGRIQPDKGVAMAIDATKSMNIRLVVIGNGRIEDVYPECPDHVRQLGVLSLHEKVKWLKKARCVFVPTLYMEPFSFAALEAQMCGTPVLCTRWGGPSEIVLHGRTGFHCDTLNSFVQACKRCVHLNPLTIRKEAVDRFSVSAVTPFFLEYFDKVQRFVNGVDNYYTVDVECSRKVEHGMGKLFS